jgi:hypothetical protein
MKEKACGRNLPEFRNAGGVKKFGCDPSVFSKFHFEYHYSVERINRFTDFSFSKSRPRENYESESSVSFPTIPKQVEKLLCRNGECNLIGRTREEKEQFSDR